jgi:hypothetical protein
MRAVTILTTTQPPVTRKEKPTTLFVLRHSPLRSQYVPLTAVGLGEYDIALDPPVAWRVSLLSRSIVLLAGVSGG